MPEEIMIEEEQVKVGDELYNVAESFALYDTMAITRNLANLSQQPPGWFATWAAAGLANDWHFYDIRNVALCDRAYNNQDTRDQTSFGYLLEKLSVYFFSPNITTQLQDDDADFHEPYQSAIWSALAPQHCSVELRINQDQHLNINALMLGGGQGPTGGGGGQGGGPFAAAPSTQVVMGGVNQGVESISSPWAFPVPLGIPRRAAISVVIRPSEYLRRLLQQENGPYYYPFWDTTTPVPGSDKYACMFGIRVTMHGKRLVQPRGSYHA